MYLTYKLKHDCLIVDLQIHQWFRAIVWVNTRIKYLQTKSGINILWENLSILSHTQPDIAYAVSMVCQFMHCPSEDHMNAVF